MVRKIEADGIAWLDLHSMKQSPRQIFSSSLHLSKRDLLARRTIDKRDPIVTPGRRIVADLLPVKHERIDVRVGNIRDIPKWSLDNMISIDLDVCHEGEGKRGISRGKKRLVPNHGQRQGTFYVRAPEQLIIGTLSVIS